MKDNTNKKINRTPPAHRPVTFFEKATGTIRSRCNCDQFDIDLKLSEHPDWDYLEGNFDFYDYTVNTVAKKAIPRSQRYKRPKPDNYISRRRAELPTLEEQVETLVLGGQPAEDLKELIRDVHARHPKE